MLSGAKSESHRRSLLASLAMLAAIAAFAATSTTHAGTRAGVTCRFEIATHRLTVTFHNDDANGGILRRAGRLVVEDVFGPIGCAGAEDPTRFNTDLVRVRAREASLDDLEFKLDLAGGPFEPGFSDEGDGSSEIEFSVPFPAGSASRMPIFGSRVPDQIVLGHLRHRQGANLNATEDVDDPDVRIRGGTFLVYGFDVVSARGGGGFLGPYRRSLFAVGTPGDDLLSGGPKRDYLIGRRGHDTMKGDGGADFLKARDHTRDVVRCGEALTSPRLIPSISCGAARMCERKDQRPADEPPHCATPARHPAAGERIIRGDGARPHAYREVPPPPAGRRPGGDWGAGRARRRERSDRGRCHLDGQDRVRLRRAGVHDRRRWVGPRAAHRRAEAARAWRRLLPVLVSRPNNDRVDALVSER